MRIGIYAGKLQKNTHGGGHTFEVNFINSLINTETNHEIYFYYDSKSLTKPYEDTANIKFINVRLEAKGLYFLPCIKKNIFNYLTKRDNIDLVYYCTPKYAYCEKPYIFTVWDLGHRVAPHFPEENRKKEFLKREKLYNSALPKASFIVIGTQDGKNDICKYYDIDENKVRLIKMPTPADVFELNGDENILHKLNIEKEKYLFYPAQFWAHKNHYVLIETLKVLREKGSDLKLVFSGSDHGNMSYIKSKIKEYELENDVIFAGFVTRAELISLYKNAFALTYASMLGPDNIPPLEAMALGCPVIISNLQGHIDQLNDCVTYFDPLKPDELAEIILNYKRDEEKLNYNKGVALGRNSNHYVEEAFKLIEELIKIMNRWK